MKCTMAILLSAFLGMSILGCQSKQAATNTTREQATAWIGYPQNAPDWQYRYVFDSPDMKSGWVEHKRDDGWFLSGPMEELKHNAASVTFKGPIGVPGKLLYFGFILEKSSSSTNQSIMRMTCDAFDSRAIDLVFKKELHNNAIQSDARTSRR